MLDVSVANKGVLIPRVGLTSATDVVTIATPAISLLVYNTGFSPNGYYFFNGTSWSMLSTGVNWQTTGNSGTNATTNYVGTTDATDLVFRTNGIERMRINNAVSASTTTAGDVLVGGATSGTIKSNTELVMRQDGDQFGSSALRLRNRNGENGAIFETLNPSPGINLVDFLFKTGPVAAPIVSNIRFEARTTNTKVTGNTTEWQFGQPDAANGGPTLVIGAFGTGSKSSFRIGNVGFGTTNPLATLHNAGTTAFTTGTGGTANTIILQNAGTFATPTAAPTNSGVVYIIRNTSTTTDTIVNNIINFGAAAPVANFNLTPAIGAIMIVSNGTSWYRIQ